MEVVKVRDIKVGDRIWLTVPSNLEGCTARQSFRVEKVLSEIGDPTGSKVFTLENGYIVGIPGDEELDVTVLKDYPDRIFAPCFTLEERHWKFDDSSTPDLIIKVREELKKEYLEIVGEDNARILAERDVKRAGTLDISE